MGLVKHWAAGHGAAVASGCALLILLLAEVSCARRIEQLSCIGTMGGGSLGGTRRRARMGSLVGSVHVQAALVKPHDLIRVEACGSTAIERWA